MQIKKTAKYYHRIKALFDLRDVDKARYETLFAKTLKEFDVSKNTIYRDVTRIKNGDNPRVRKPRHDKGRRRRLLEPSEIAAIDIQLQAGKTPDEIYASFRNDETAPQKNLIRQAVDILISDTLAECIEKGMRLKYRGKFYVIAAEDVEDLELIINNAMNRALEAEGVSERLPANRRQQRKRMIMQLIEAQTKIAMQTNDYKHVEALTRMYDRMDKDSNTNITGDFATLEKVVKHLAPEISKSDLIDLIKKLSAEQK